MRRKFALSSYALRIQAGTRWRLNRLELEICQIHIAFGEDMHGEHILSRGKFDPNYVLHNIPVMPLPPCDRLGGIVGRLDRVGPVASTPLTSIEIVPPRFEV